MPTKVRLNRFLRDCRLGSRRKCESLIEEGRVTVGGEAVTELGTLVDPAADQVRVDGEVVRPYTDRIYIAVNKPRGVVVTASDPQGRTTVYEAVRDLPEGVFNIGRLDMDSEGLLLLTNDGKLGFRLSHPRFEIEKVYRVGVLGRAGDDVPGRLMDGIELEEGRAVAKLAAILDRGGDRTTLEITLTEGKKREIRRMLEACGFEVDWLRRVRFGSVSLADLEPGRWRHLTRDEVRSLRRMVEETYLKKLKDSRPARKRPEED